MNAPFSAGTIKTDGHGSVHVEFDNAEVKMFMDVGFILLSPQEARSLASSLLRMAAAAVIERNRT